MLRLITGRPSYWLRGICAGTMLTVLITLAAGLAVAAVRDEQPFQRGKQISSQTMDTTIKLCVPIAATLGAVLGGGFAEYLWRRRGQTTPCGGPSSDPRPV